MLYLLAGYLKSADCGARRSGVAIIYLIQVVDLTEFTLSSDSSDWSAVTPVTDKVFKKYEFKKGEAELLMNPTPANGIVASENSIEFNMDKLSQLSRDAVQEISDASNCGLIAIVKTNQGDNWVLGYDNYFQKEHYLELTSGTGTSGRALTDLQGFVLTLANTSPELPRTFTGSVPLT
jgi:hypothetical protein